MECVNVCVVCLFNVASVNVYVHYVIAYAVCVNVYVTDVYVLMFMWCVYMFMWQM